MTVAKLLQSNGYRTAAIGKWHLGLTWEVKAGEIFNFQRSLPWSEGSLSKEEESKIDFEKPVSGGPTELGFDYFFGTSACATCNTPYCYIQNNRIIELPSIYYKGEFIEQRNGFRSPSFNEATVDSIFTVEAIKFMEQSVKNEQPFFLYLAASAPHEPAEEAVVPKFMRGISKAGARGDLVLYFDWMVGQVTESLKQLGVEDNTLIIVTSDNGAKPGDNNRITYGHKSNGDLRGFKGGVWEGGHRVPLIAKWPDKVTPGSLSKHLVGLQDLMATVGEILDISLPDDAGEDSKSFLSTLTGVNDSIPIRTDIVHHSTNGVFVIRQGDWKLIIDCDNSGDGGRGVNGNEGTNPDPSMRGQLYNLADDPFELFNLIDRNKTKEKELRNILEKYKESGRNVSWSQTKRFLRN
jgi:arylsulfatase A-like enzyme